MLINYNTLKKSNRLFPVWSKCVYSLLVSICAMLVAGGTNEGHFPLCFEL